MIDGSREGGVRGTAGGRKGNGNLTEPIEKHKQKEKTMLTSDEKELLEALKAQADDEQKEALSQMPEADLKELLKEAKKEIEKEMRGHGASPEEEGCMGKMRAIRDCPWGEVIRDDGKYNLGNPFHALILKILLKIGSTKVGCAFLIVVAIAIAIAIAVANS